jgi:hypothetical protein
MSEFRDPDRSDLNAFSTHISIAETMIELNAELTGGLHIKSTEEECRAPMQAWEDFLEQAVQARAIAVKFRRDVTAFDAAWARTGARTRVYGKGLVVATPARQAAVEALDALRAAFPEIVVPRKAPPKTEMVDTSPLFSFGPALIYRITLFVTVLGLLIAISVCGVR